MIQRLRRHRARPERATALAGLLASEAESLGRLRKRLGGAGRAWSACCPEALAGLTAPVGLSGGVLRVAARDASARYRVDRWLRGGGLSDLRRASSAPISRVRVEIGAAGGVS